MLTQKLIKELFVYKEGLLCWRTTGQEACPRSFVKGYKTVKIKGRNYKQHRVIFLYHHGYLPKALDHRDRVKTNNKIDNLRPATKNGNNHNVGLSKHNTSGYKGVYFHKPRNKWRAMIKINKKQITLGGFNTKEEAAEAYNKAATLYHGKFAYINKIPSAS